MKKVKFEVYIPKSHVDALREALNKIGALTIGNYDHCISTTDVKGYFRPLENSNPYDGEIGHISIVDEVKVEFQSSENKVNAIIEIIKTIHPYEEPVYHIIPLLNV